MQTGHSDFFVRDKESEDYFDIVTGEVNAHLYLTPGMRLFVRYSGARKKLLRKTFVVEEVETPPTVVLYAMDMCSTQLASWADSTASGTTAT